MGGHPPNCELYPPRQDLQVLGLTLAFPMPQCPPSPSKPGLRGGYLSKVSAVHCEDVDTSMTEMLTQGTIPSCKFLKTCPLEQETGMVTVGGWARWN